MKILCFWYKTPNAVKPHDTPRMSSAPPRAPHHLWSPAVTVAFGEKKGWVTSSGVQRMDMAMKMGDLDGFRMDLGQWYLEGCLSLPLTFNIYLGWRIQSYWHLSYEMKPSNWFHVMLVNVGLFAVTSSSTCPEWPRMTKCSFRHQDERRHNHLCLAQEMCNEVRCSTEVREVDVNQLHMEPPPPGHHHSLPLHFPWVDLSPVKAPVRHQGLWP
jgi:hypothetical protein